MMKDEMDHISKDIRDLVVECKTGLCKIIWSAPEAVRRPVLNVMKNLYKGAGVQMIGDEAIIVVLRGGILGPVNAEEALQEVAEKREKFLRAIAEGAMPPVFTGDVDNRYWPPPRAQGAVGR